MADGDLIPIVKQIVKSGVSCIPIELPSKKPYKSLKWTPYMKQRPTMEECEKFWANGAGLALVCGAVSGNLEILDFDVPGKSAEGYTPVSSPPAWKPFLEILKEHGHDDLLKKCLIHRTPSGGRGIFYRCPGPPLPGNTKLAATAKNEVLIETRGQGGYFGTAPSTGYELLQGDLSAIPVIQPDEREILLSVARMLDERTIDNYEKTVRAERSVGGVYGDTPADWYNANGPHLLDILEKHGWAECGRAGQRIAVVRPGKTAKQGMSGTVTADGGCFWCFSTSTVFRNEYAYTKFSVYAQLEFNGDMHTAARTIRREMMPQSSIQRQTQEQRIVESESVEERRKTGWQVLTEVAVEKVDWLFEPYIPLGEVTLLVGDPGVGKSTVAQAIATAVTRGGSIGGIPVKKGKVIFMSAEQSLSKITKPRFMQMQADMSQIVCPDEDDPNGDTKPFMLDFGGIQVLNEQAAAWGADLIVIDTMTAYIEAARDINTANSVREWMRKLIAVARANNLAILVLMHPNKTNSTNPLYKIMGSIDFVGAARSALYAGADSEDDEMRAVNHVKSNVGPKGKTLGYAIDPVEGFLWVDGVHLSIDRVLEPRTFKDSRGKREACEEWLRSLFRGEDTRIDSTTLYEEAKMLGFSRNLLFELKPKLQLKTEKEGFGRDSKTYWMPLNSMGGGGERWDQK